jgi:6-phosphofructokinase 1
MSRGNAGVVVAEDADQKYVTGNTKEQDISGNIKLGDIGIYLRDTFRQYVKQIEMTSFVRYINPSYISYVVYRQTWMTA